jgi:hypothetical protein
MMHTLDSIWIQIKNQRVKKKSNREGRTCTCSTIEATVTETSKQLRVSSLELSSMHGVRAAAAQAAPQMRSSKDQKRPHGTPNGALLRTTCMGESLALEIQFMHSALNLLTGIGSNLKLTAARNKIARTRQ